MRFHTPEALGAFCSGLRKTSLFRTHTNTAKMALFLRSPPLLDRSCATTRNTEHKQVLGGLMQILHGRGRGISSETQPHSKLNVPWLVRRGSNTPDLTPR